MSAPLVDFPYVQALVRHPAVGCLLLGTVVIEVAEHAQMLFMAPTLRQETARLTDTLSMKNATQGCQIVLMIVQDERKELYGQFIRHQILKS